jgi:tRNA G18 (ribose-2'-O)-methylase SpoU
VAIRSTPRVVGSTRQQSAIVAVEQDRRSITYSLLPNLLKFPVAIIVGNETDGISKEILDLSDIIVELPMFGVNKSFNVWGSCAVVAYKAVESLIWHPYRPRRAQKNRLSAA